MKRLNVTGWTLLMTLLLTALFGTIGCSSDDPVTPHDETDLTSEDVAHQAGFLAYSIVNVLPTMANKAMPELTDLLPDFNGDFWIDSNPDHVWTDADHMLSFEPEGFNVSISCEFDITSVGGLANGTGTLTAGTLVVGFTVSDVSVMSSGYPTAGQVIVTSGAITAIVTFNGGTATVQVGTMSWTIDLSDGTLVS